MFCTVTLALSAVCVQCPIWLFLSFFLSFFLFFLQFLNFVLYRYYYYYYYYYCCYNYQKQQSQQQFFENDFFYRQPNFKKFHGGLNLLKGSLTVLEVQEGAKEPYVGLHSTQYIEHSTQNTVHSTQN